MSELDSEEEYVGLSERIRKITSATPDRFKRYPARREDNGRAGRLRATRARSPKFATDSRVRSARKAREDNRSTKVKPRARGAVGAPNLRTAARSEYHPKPEAETFDTEFKAKPAPPMTRAPTRSSSRNCSMLSSKSTQFAPFSFDSRPPLKSSKKMDTSSQSFVSERSHQPGNIPDYGKLRRIGQGAVSKKEITRPKAFKFKTGTRAENKTEFKPKPVYETPKMGQSRTTVEEMNKALQGHRMKTIASKEATVPQSPGLKSSRRAVKRAEFDDEMSLKRAEDEKVRQQVEENQKIIEENELKDIRRGLVHKPQPIRGMSPAPEISPADKTLTMPHTPKLRTSARIRARHDESKMEE